jgi:hypothetical protein
MDYPSYRRCFGLVYGGIAGFAFALISQGINLLFMPGTPLYQPPLGLVGNVLLISAVCLLLGLTTAWAESGGVSVLWSSLLGALFVSIGTFLSGQDSGIAAAHRAAAVIFIFLPISGATAIPLILLRWVVTREENAYREARAGMPTPRLRRYLLPVGLVLVTAALGLTSLYNDIGRSVTPQMHRLIQQGMQAQGADALPAALQPPDVDQFFERASGPYTLQWDRDEANQFAIPRPASNMQEQSTVIARFENGYLLACMFPGKTGPPTCRDF